MQSILAANGLCQPGTEGRSVTRRGYIVWETISFSTFWMESTKTILKYLVKLLISLIEKYYFTKQKHKNFGQDPKALVKQICA